MVRMLRQCRSRPRCRLAALAPPSSSNRVAASGATQNPAAPGRYQMEAEATINGSGSREYKVFVLDTTTGDVWNAPIGQRPPRGT